MSKSNRSTGKTPPSKSKLTARDIQMAIGCRMFNRLQEAILFNVQDGPVCGEADILVVRPSLWGIEIEVKTSLSDFKADFKKAERTTYSGYRYPGKHDQIVNGKPIYVRSGGGYYHPTDRACHNCRYFYFAIPEELLEKVLPLLPPYAGLITVSERGWPQIVRKAPINKKAEKYTHQQMAKLYRTAYCKYWDQLIVNYGKRKR